MATNPTITLPKINMGANSLPPVGPLTTTTSTTSTTSTPPRVPFFNPTPISKKQYMSGPVDFYSQTLDTTGVGVVDAPDLDEDEDEDGVEAKRTDHDIRGGDDPFGGGDQDDNQLALSYSMGKGYTNKYELTSFGVDDINFGPNSNNTYDFTKPGSMTMDRETGEIARDLNSSWADSAVDYAKEAYQGLKAGAEATKAQGLTLESLGQGISGGARPFGPGTTTVGAPGVVNVAMPGLQPLTALAGGMTVANHARNAAAYRATGGSGGFIGVVGSSGAMISRMPGGGRDALSGMLEKSDLKDPFSGVPLSRNYLGGQHFSYTGLPPGMTNTMMAAREAASLGFVPGTLQEKYEPTSRMYIKSTSMVDKNGKPLMNYLDAKDMSRVGGTYNPKTGNFIDLNGRSYGGGTRAASEAYVGKLNNKFGSTLHRSAVFAGRAGARQRGIDFVDYMEQEAIKSGVSATGLSFAQINSIRSGNFLVRGTGGSESGLNTRGFSTFSDFRGDSESAANAPGVSPEDVMSAEVQAQVNAAMAAQYDPNPGGEQNNDPDDFGGSQDYGSATGEDQGNYGETEDYKQGGRVGMQQGGPAGFAERPEFVGGNQRPTDQQSIADDQPREVQEGTFVINSAAADEMGRDDVEKMIRHAYQKAGESGMGAGQQGMSQEVAIAVSRGEVTIPPHIAKIIGYDRLRKINNRGKKEVSRRQQEREQAAGGGFISRKKFAEGEKVTVYRGEPIDSSKVVATDYGYGGDDVGKFHTPDVKRAGRFAAGAGKGNQVIRSRKVTVNELFDGVKEAWKVQQKKKTGYFKQMSKKSLNDNLKFVDNLKKDYATGKRSLEDMAMFLQEQVFHDGKSKINFIETFKNDPKSAGKLAGRAIAKAATVATPPLAFLAGAAEMLTPSSLGKGTRYDDSFMSYQYTPNK